MADFYLFVVVIMMLTPPNHPSDQGAEPVQLVVTTITDENNQIIEAIQVEYRRLLQEPLGQGQWRSLSETELWLLLCRCMLSTEVAYEKALSTVETAWKNGQLNPYMLADLGAEKAFVRQLSSLLGTKKGQQYGLYFVANARKFRNQNISWILNDSESEEAAREKLCGTFKGVGLQEASMFLQDSCYASRLVVIDKHILRFLKIVGWVKPDVGCSQIDRKAYHLLEYIWKGYCDNYGVDPRRMEQAVRKVMRQTKP